MSRETKEALMGFGARALDMAYDATFLSVMGFGAALVILSGIGVAIGLDLMHAPEFHPPL